MIAGVLGLVGVVLGAWITGAFRSEPWLPPCPTVINTTPPTIAELNESTILGEKTAA